MFRKPCVLLHIYSQHGSVLLLRRADRMAPGEFGSSFTLAPQLPTVLLVESRTLLYQDECCYEYTVLRIRVLGPLNSSAEVRGHRARKGPLPKRGK